MNKEELMMAESDSVPILFTFIPFIVIAGFILVFILILVSAVKGLSQWNRNNHSPVLTVTAKIVTKRADVSHTNHNQAGSNVNYTSSYTSYYATFEVESGDRMELRLEASEYGLLAEGDTGRLTFQGTRYQGFERTR
jgi:hypothetical protein